MRGNRKIVMLVCAVILAAAVFTGIGSIFKASGFTYDHADKYTAGNAAIEGTVKSLDVHWISGEVKIEYHSGKTVTLSETSKKEISGDRQLRWWLDGDTLRVQYEKSGMRWFGFNHPKKELTIGLPEGMSLDNVDIEATSGNLTIPSLETDRLKLDVTSGDINVMTGARDILVDATSGTIALKSTSDAEKITVKTTSGNVSVEAKNADTLKISCTSGDITAALAAFDRLEIDATSGDITLKLPEKPGFTADLDVTSGKISYDLPLSRDGRKYICGNGSGEVDVDTTSGNIRIEAFEER